MQIDTALIPSRAHVIKDVPFYPQQAFYCGPTTLAEVFSFYGEPVSPNQIAPKLFIPEYEGSLKVEMVSATRQFDLLPYTDNGNLQQIIQLVSDDIPVIVFQNLSIALFPQWHYAVVIGFDLERREIELHTGVTPNHRMSFELFEKTWRRGDYWFLAPVPPQHTSSTMKYFVYTSAAFDMLKLGQTTQALNFLQTAIQRWPNEWLAYFLIANHFLADNPGDAIAWFKKGYHVGQYHSAYLNNFAIALQQSGCAAQAQKVLQFALQRFPDDDRLLATHSQFTDALSAADQASNAPGQCNGPPPHADK
ncbi:PA2778 family cysteine peptidase [Alteromonas gilva]|uniref:PA2778 family cysteine peptidase n=1 Tax=Alteromonas gilva TaxID=2987522 RepID=A0ABT5L302_9ALTE|nr:PA2778 family cysteine peptidase [Alteromonas gilva]MDC8830799.1 PA2778 family cysteine peptidase [Alteromonas gilva]